MFLSCLLCLNRAILSSMLPQCLYTAPFSTFGLQHSTTTPSHHLKMARLNYRSMLSEFNMNYGADETKLEGWKRLCFDCGVAVGSSITNCKVVGTSLKTPVVM